MNGEVESVPELLSPQNARFLLDSTEAFLFDCDGWSLFLFQFDSIQIFYVCLFIYLFLMVAFDCVCGQGLFVLENDSKLVFLIVSIN